MLIWHSSFSICSFTKNFRNSILITNFCNLYFGINFHDSVTPYSRRLTVNTRVWDDTVYRTQWIFDPQNDGKNLKKVSMDKTHLGF